MEDCMDRRPEHLRDVRPEELDCNWALLTKILKDIINRLNATTDKVQEHECRLNSIDTDICNIKQRLDELEERAAGWDECCDEISGIAEIVNSIQNIIDDMNAFNTWVKNHLPIMYEYVPADWKFGMGNINVTSGGPTSGNGIYTREEDQNNDLDFQ